MKKFTLLFVLALFGFNQYSNAQCVPTPGQSTIGGKAFTDTNQNGSQQPFEGDEPGITIDLYEDANANGILDSGEQLLQSTTTNATGDYTFWQGTVIVNETISDEFNAVSFGGNSGTINWTNNWQQFGETDGESRGVIQVRPGTGITSNALRFGVYDERNHPSINNNGVYRIANLSGAQSATLSFDFEKNEDDTPDANVDVQVSTDGTSWTTLKNFDFDDTVQQYTYNINSFISATTYIRFIGDDEFKERKYDYLYFDNISISFQFSKVILNYIVKLNESSLGAGYTITTPNQYAVNFTANGEASCDNDYGLYNCGLLCTPIANDDNVTVLQGNSITIDVLSNDSDGNNNIDVNSLTIITQPTFGSLTNLPSGEIIYLPNGNFFGSDSFQYEVCDSTPITPLCDTATVNITVLENVIDPCLQAAKNHVYYIPYSDSDLRTAFSNSDSGSCPEALGNNVRRITSIKSPYPGNVIIYDHWEDGYEADINNPVQATTQVWGDNDPVNGTAPGYPDDYIPSGGNFVLQNTYNYNPRNPVEIYFDGKDKIHSSADIALSTVAGDDNRFALQAAKTDVYDTGKFGTSFTVPFGEEIGLAFTYTGLFIRAEKDNTTVNVDLDNNGVVEASANINEGEVYFIDGGINSGASITSSEPIGVDLFFGGNDCFGTRQINLLPAVFYSDTYYSPVPTTNASNPAVVFFYNSLSTQIDIDWVSSLNSGTVTVPSNSSASLSLSDNSAYKFTSQGGESYVASEIVDLSSPATAYDWAFNLISEERLTDFAAIAWAPGSLDGTRNDNPVWVTPSANTTLYIKFDGDLTSTTSLISPCGIPYDTSVAANYLDYQKIFDTFNSDNDQSGLAVYTCDGTKIFAVYGEDPSLALDASPSLDVGTTMQPLCLQPLIFAIDDRAFGTTDTSLAIPVLFNDTKFITNINTGSVSTSGLLQPQNGVANVNPDGTINYIPNTGFIGVDSFEYSLCSLEYATVCDTATVFVTIAACPTPANQNMVFGQVFLDLNEDMINNDGIGVANVKVDIYEDLNLNGVIDGGDLPLPTTPSTTTDINGNYQFEVPTYNIVIEDDFSSNTYTGGSGWNGNWTEVGESDGPATGDIGFSSSRLKVRNNKSVYRQVDLSEAIFGTISFDAGEDGIVDLGDDVIVEICSDNSFFNCQTLFFKADDFTSATISNTFIDLDKLTSTAVFRIATTGYTALDEEFHIDNIRILTSIRGKNLLLETDLATLPSGHTLSTDNLETSDFAPTGSVGFCDKTNDFGFLVCNMTDSGLTILCNDNGTPLDATDDSYSFTLNPVGARTGASYSVSGDVTGSGTYGIDTVFGPYPSDGVTKTITITDNTGNCKITDFKIIASVSHCLSSNSFTSIDFDGVDDYLSTTGFLDGLQEVTLMAWVKIDPSYGGGETLTIVSEDISGMLTINSGNAPVFTVRTDITPTIALNANPIINDEWHHIAGTFSGITGELNIYVDGKFEGISPTDFTGAAISITGLGNGNFEVGRFSKDTAPDQNYFFGAIDEVRVFDSALTESQIQRMVYQEIEQNGINVKGTTINKDIVDSASSNPILWNNLKAYYPMTNVANSKTFDISGNLRDVTLYNIINIQPQTAPMPYETVADGPWTTESTWLHGDVWDIEDIPNNKDWSIVHIKNDVTTSGSHTQLGMHIDAGNKLTVSGDNAITNNSYLELNGTLDLADDSQLVQTETSDLVSSATGKILRRQEGNTDVFWYNYWSSPVGALGATTLSDNNGTSNNTNNTPFNIDMIMDGTGADITFTSAFDQAGMISDRWLYSYQNGIIYYDWVTLTPASAIAPGVGYTQKGTGIDSNPDPMITEQQYTFVGKPNNGTILIAADDVDGDAGATTESVQDVSLTTILIGNPYPSALDADEFIRDNIDFDNGFANPIIQGTILLWEQWAGTSHWLAEYEGGYGFINLTDTERAYQHQDIMIADPTNPDNRGIKTPTRFIPIGQGFFVEVIADIGNIEFNNSQRVFKQESLSDSVFFRNGDVQEDNPASSSENRVDEMQILRLEFGVSSGASRSFVLGFSNFTTDNFDYGYDGGLITNPPADDMGSILNGEQYVIQAFAPITPNKEVNLVMHSSGTFTHTLKSTEITNIPDGQALFIRDNLNGNIYNLRSTEPYNFTSVSGTFSDRFQVIFKDPTLSVNTEELNNVLIYVNAIQNSLFIKGLNEDVKSISITSMLGQTVTSFNNMTVNTAESGIYLGELSSGVYLVNLITKNNLKLNKKVIIK